MKHVSFTLLSLAVAGTLSACGGGSSDGGAAVQTTPSTPNATANSTNNGRVTSTTNNNTNTATNTTSNTNNTSRNTGSNTNNTGGATTNTGSNTNTNPTNTNSNPTNTNTSGNTNTGGTSNSNTNNTGGSTGGTNPNTANTGSNTNTSHTQTVVNVTNRTSSLRTTTSTAPVSDKRYASLTVDGKTYQLLDIDTAPNIIHVSEDTKQQVVASGRLSYLSYLRYGMVHDKTNGKHYLYHMGDRTPTAAMPTTGGATYTGRAVHVDYKNAKTTINVNSVFHVNFAEKTVKGAITGPDAPDGRLPLNATISGNTFKGYTSGTEVNGIFYGSTAQELGGTYINSSRQFGGAFGARK